MFGLPVDADSIRERGPGVVAARFVAGRLARRGRVLVVGAGEGLAATALSRAGFAVVGVEDDPMLVAAARARDALTTWVAGADGKVALTGTRFDSALLGEEWILARRPGELASRLASVARHVRSGAELVAGLPTRATDSLDALALATYDRAALVAGLSYAARFGDWVGTAYHPGLPFAVSVHRQP